MPDKDVAVIGVGQSAFVRGYPGGIRELCFEAYREAMQDAGIPSKEIKALIVCCAPEYDKQRSPSSLIDEYLGLTPAPAFMVESLCSSSTTGFAIAYSFIKSGLYDVVCVLGFQKMSEITSQDVQERMGRGADVMWESPYGTSMPAYYAMYAQAHFANFGTKPDDLALVRVKASTYGQLNEKAVYRKKVTFEQVMESGLVSSPLKVMDCCANADGSSCVILASADRAKEFSKKPVWVMGVGQSNAPMNLASREHMRGLECARIAGEKAYAMAGVGPHDIDVAEVHDCFTIAEILAYEALGFAKPGEGPQLIRDKETYLEGKIPVNVDGGLLSKGHPIGATGGSQLRTIVMQLRGEAGAIQAPNAEIGLVHNIGGVGIYGNVIILGR